MKGIRDKAEALRKYAKSAGKGLRDQNKCAELKIRAERRAGELLAGMDGKGSHGGDRKSSNGVLLEDLGISRMQSHRWQTIASVPDNELEAYIASKRDSETELTSAALYKMGKQSAAMESVESEQPVHEDCTDDLNDFIKAGAKFGTIYADPAWRYGNQGTRAATDNHYQTMTVAEIAALPVNQFVADDAHLHLWTTNAFLFEAKAVIEAWGFEYKSVMVWTKPQLGIGNYWRVSHEFLLLGVRGKPKFRDHSVKSWQTVERGEHSAKPEHFRKLIERVSPGPYLEMFARIAPHGWSAWGNQIQGREMYGQ